MRTVQPISYITERRKNISNLSLSLIISDNNKIIIFIFLYTIHTHGDEVYSKRIISLCLASPDTRMPPSLPVVKAA